jgi:hypothetical protein
METGFWPSTTAPATEHARAEFRPARRLRQRLDHLERARPVRQPADEAALLERGDEAVDAGLGLQVERFLHLVEGGRDSRIGEPLLDVAQQLVLLAGQHIGTSFMRAAA